MAIQTKTIKQKMTSVKSIQKITKAMEMISVSKMANPPFFLIFEISKVEDFSKYLEDFLTFYF